MPITLVAMLATILGMMVSSTLLAALTVMEKKFWGNIAFRHKESLKSDKDIAIFAFLIFLFGLILIVIYGDMEAVRAFYF